ncbi:MAG: multidrug efflux RND transporter permease subunit [Desulfobacteraceae bacterium]|nr:multidrug efflux RND transporter permease subunit [Desulfobacteraceae bacterium]
MFSRFFIERPIFANVLAILTMIFGVVTMFALPVEQFPDITPPTVKVSAVYPGANAQVVADTVAAPIEQQVNGVERMLYMSSTSANDGSYQLTVTFDVGTNLDMAQVLVQNRVSIAEPQLPDEVKRQGVTVKKQSTAIILFVALSSELAEYDDLYLSNYATLNVRDELSRIEGVGDVSVVGSAAYSMRIWLDPEKLKARGLTTQDVVNAIQEQNVQVAAGQIGQPPAPAGQNFQYTVTTLGRLSEVAEFENIILKMTVVDNEARIIRVKDVARVELGGQVYDQYFQKNGKPASGISIYQLPGANALDVADKVRAKMEELSKVFPKGISYDIPFDTTKFVKASIHEIYKTLIEAGLLVLIVILLFLQDWRAVLVPATTVPVTIIGAFAAMAGLGFTVNMLTLFGLVLAIGIVVDDAIVIVENAAHHIETGMAPKPATIKAMDEILGPVIGITMVLMAVFLPTAFLGGITGQLYRQFALTIAATAVISALNAVTLKPAQCAVYLRPSDPAKRNFFFRGFNAVYARCEDLYASIVRGMVRFSGISMLVFVGLLAVTLWGFLSLPTGFLPTEDQGYVVASVQLPDSASQERTRETIRKMNAIIGNTPGIADWITIGGYSVLDGTVIPNAAAFYIVFKDWSERTDPSLSQEAILQSLRRHFYGGIQEGVAFAFAPPAIMGLGVAGGFQMQLEDRRSTGVEVLQSLAMEMVTDGEAQSGLEAMNTTFRAGIPQLYADVDRVKVKSLNVTLGNVFNTLQAYLGSAYTNDFNKFGRTFQVRIQADQKFRASAEDIKRLDVRTNDGKYMVPIGTFVQVRESLGPQLINRYNLYPSAAINGEAAPGYSSGQALKLMEDMAAKKLPPSMGYEWTGMSYQEKKVSGQAFMIFGLAVLLVYLVLCAQYESWTNPAAVILVVPLALLGSVVAVFFREMDNNVYTQIGIVLLIALASKNAILIVEFARELRAKGEGIKDAAVHAARMRFRPILMTSFAFILGVYPLVNAEGAGAASRRALGTAVFGGMIASTFLAVLFVPVFYTVLQTMSEWMGKGKK